MSVRIVAIDGPAGAGKSTVARQLAGRLGFTIIDTGAIYRAVALAARRAGVAWDDDEGLGKLLDAGLRLKFDADRVLLRGEDVTEAIRTPEISRGASVVSARPVVRQKLLQLQRDLGRASTRGSVLEGRDIGTVVFPDAQVKFFLTASDGARAQRRHAELADRGLSVPLEEVLSEQRRRDKDDTERAIAPLRAAPDAIVVDTTGLDLGEVVERCFREASSRLKHLISGQP
ncbi:MAG TPA: (d)CMP kinase [Myxococcales bacterium]|nr:(d)CMP kinase [Myxococcales bacterium]